MRTKNRLMLWLGVMTMLVLLLAGVSLGTIWNLRTEGRNVLTANYNSIEYAQHMLKAMDAEGDSAARSHSLLELLTDQRANNTEKGEAELTEELGRSTAAFNANPNDATKSRALRMDINDIIDLNRAAIVRKTAQAEHRAELSLFWISITGTLCFLISFSLFFSLPEQIAEPIRQLTEGIDRIAAGNYRERVMIEGRGEFGHMADRFNAMAGQLERWENSSLAQIMAEKSRVEAILNSMVNAAFGVDPEGRIIFANLKAAELLGLGEADLVGRTIGELTARNDLLRYVLSEGDTRPFKAVLGGKEQFFTSSQAPIRSAKGDLGTVHLLHNITPFQERDEARTHFLATISHELKTPLASTDLGLGLLENSKTLSDEQHSILEDLRKDHQRLVRIVSELLDLTQIETGRIRVALGDHALSGIVHKAVAALHTAADAKQVRLDVQIGADNLFVHADAEKSSWALINLLSNAVRHSPQQSTVSLTTYKEGNNVLLAVSDQGPGLSEEQVAHLFERFNPHASSGSGLGLSIARDFMRAMNGDIFLSGTSEKGSVFTIAFAGASPA